LLFGFYPVPELVVLSLLTIQIYKLLFVYLKLIYIFFNYFLSYAKQYRTASEIITIIITAKAIKKPPPKTTSMRVKWKKKQNKIYYISQAKLGIKNQNINQVNNIIKLNIPRPDRNSFGSSTNASFKLLYISFIIDII